MGFCPLVPAEQTSAGSFRAGVLDFLWSLALWVMKPHGSWLRGRAPPVDALVYSRLLVEADTLGSSSLVPFFAGEESEALRGQPQHTGRVCVGRGDPVHDPAPGTRSSTAPRGPNVPGTAGGMDKVQTFMGQGLRCRVSHRLLGDPTWLVLRPHRVARVWALCLPFLGRLCRHSFKARSRQAGSVPSHGCYLALPGT